MSPVFRHGRLRLYLLKLLDEAPRHGYEIIRLLQDRFLGVYAPSPGTIYPRLARLEEEGLVTHDETDGRKVYRITDKGREELRSRLDDLAELEETITASVRDIAREVTEDVRETVRNLREEIAWAVRDVQPGPRPAQRDTGKGGAGDRPGWGEGDKGKGGGAGDRPGSGERDKAKGGAGDWPGWGARGWPGRGPGGWAGHGPGGWADPRTYRDLERLAKQFSRDLRTAVWQAQAVSDDAVRQLRQILDETIGRIRDEVFGGQHPRQKPPHKPPSTSE